MMCGIAGIFHYGSDEPIADSAMRAMTAALVHRGPDDEGYYTNGRVALGHRRLSIVDLAGGHQPMATADGRLVVCYNGEVYNHPILKPELERLGRVYRTTCDTETLLHGYAAWGDGVLDRCNGMFAFALWDAAHQRLLVARDRLGIKPLLYYDDGQRLLVASEMNALLAHPAVPREIDAEALNFLLTFSYIPAPWTFLKHVRKLLPGHKLIADRDGVRTEPYWQLPTDRIEVDPQEAEAETRRLLRASVERRLMADVPLGAFLSGGIDSSIVVGLLAELVGQVRTFSIGFSQYPAFDERRHAKVVADHFRTHHREYLLDRLDLAATLPTIVRQLHEPFGDASAVPLYYVSRMAREEVKVILSGDGADELCAGYNKYTGYYWGERYGRLPAWLRRGAVEPLLAALPESRNALGNLVRKGRKVVRNAQGSPAAIHYGYMELLDRDARAALLRPELCDGVDLDAPSAFVVELFDRAAGRSALDRSLYADICNVLPNDMLTKVDTMSMRHALEVRVPFLDHEFAEWMMRLDGGLKLRGTRTKAILKSAFADLLPPETLRRKKHGFELPVGEWFRGELRPVIEELLSPAAVERRGLFVPDAPQRLLEAHLSGKHYYDFQLWTLFVLEAWQRIYLDGTPPEALFAASGSD